jgi:hypothetical protein
MEWTLRGRSMRESAKGFTLWDDLDDYSRAEYCADARAGFEECIREPSDELIEVFGEN